MVDVEHRGLAGLEQDGLALIEGVVEHQGAVDNHGPNPVRVGEQLVGNDVGIDGGPVEDLEEEAVLLVQGGVHLLTQDRLVEEVLDADAHAVHLVRVRRSDPTAGGTQLTRTQETLGGAVQNPVVGGDDVGVGADEEAGGVLAAGGDLSDLVEEDLQVDDDAVTDDGGDPGGEHTGRQEVEGELLAVDDDGVSGVVAAVELHDVVDVLTELVSRLALSLVSPLGPDDDNGWHGCSLTSVTACRWTHRPLAYRSRVERSPPVSPANRYRRRYGGDMPHVTVHRSSTQRPALAGLVAMTVFAVLALIGTPASSLPTADDDTNFHISSDIVVKDDNTFSVKLTMSESGSIPALSKSMCNKDSSTVKDSPYEDLKVKFVEKDGTRTCTMEGTGGSISTSSKNIKHEGDEYIVQTLNFDSISDEDVTEISQSVTFPGKVTEADGGTVEGTKVSFKDNDKHEVKGKDKPAKSAAAEEDSNSTPVWIWSLIGSLAVAIVGGVVGVLVMNQRKKRQSQLVAYAAAAQFYDPNQAPLGQPGQQPYQPGYAEPYQPGQPTPQPYQPGYTDPYQPGQPTPQPYQPGYAEPYQPGQPTPQLYQQGQPGQQPFQPGYADPAAQPYQQSYNNQPGQPGPRF